MRTTMRVATGDGQAALVRARGIVSALERANPGVEFLVVSVRGGGRTGWGASRCVDVDGPGGDAALGTALVEGAADIAVRGLGCSSAAPAPGTALAAVPRRADARDAFISRGGRPLASLPDGSRVGASTALRRAQVLRTRPDLLPVPVRGPADADLRRLARGDDGLAAIVVEAARLARKGLLGHAADCLPPERFLPAPGQGAVAVLAREDDPAALEAAARIDDPAARAAWEAEGALVERLAAAPDSPVGAYASVGPGGLRLTGAAYSADGAEEVRGEVSGPAGRARELGASLAGRLLEKGALAIMTPAGLAV